METECSIRVLEMHDCCVRVTAHLNLSTCTSTMAKKQKYLSTSTGTNTQKCVLKCI